MKLTKKRLVEETPLMFIINTNYQCQEKNHFHNNKKDKKSENACVHVSAKPPV